MRTRVWMLLILLAACGVAFAGASALAGSQVPVLAGPNPPSGKGFGQVRPRTIYLGGDAGGLVCHIQWLSWGNALAVGTGTGWYVGTKHTYQGHWAPAVVVLYRLGSWNSRPAYQRWTWYFPGNGSGFGRVAACNTRNI